MKDRLTVRIVLLAILLPLGGILAVSVAVRQRIRSGYLEVSRSQAGALAEVVARNIERTMLDGRADITRKAVADLRALPGIADVAVLDAGGRAAFATDAPPLEREALERLRSGGSFTRDERDSLVFYRPLANGPECRRCHGGDGSLLGAVKVAVSLAEPIRQGRAPIATAFAWSLAGTLIMGGLLWWVLHRLVVQPATRLRAAAAAVAAGDLGVDPGVTGRDEMGALGDALRRAVQGMAEVVRRVHDVARRVEGISERTEQKSAEVVRATTVETQSFENIAASMQELNASVGQIAREVEVLAAASAEVDEAGREGARSATEVLERAKELTEVVEGTADAVAMLSHTVRELSWGANHVTDVSGATLAAVHHLEETVRAVETAAAASAEHTARVRREAEELGVGSVRRALEGMEHIRESVGRTSAHLDTLGGLSQRIGEILDVIDEVTDQTGLLALNAAILAAQAGEDGAGFQVVATEIRKLAVRTAGSTEAIADVVRGVRREIDGAVSSMGEGMARVEQGMAFAREAGAALQTIVGSASAATAAAAAIPERTAGQAEDLGKVRDSMGRLDQMASFLAQGSEEQRREADRIQRSTHAAVEVARRIREANAAQNEVGRRLATTAGQLAEGVQRIAGSLAEEREGSAQIMQALVRVVDLPRQNRAEALRINQALREILGGTELLRAEAGQFRVPAEAAADVLRLGVLPLESPAAMHRRFTPLAAHLARRLGRPVELRVALDFAEAVSDLDEGKTQLAWLSPSTFVQARTRCGARLLVTALRAGRPVQHAVIVTRRGSGISSLAELRGRTFAFGDPRSTSSHIVPRAMLLEAGIALEDLAGHDHLGHHDAVARAVLAGEYDAGAVMETVAARLAAEGLVAIAQSPPVPEFCLCVRGDFPESLGQRLQAELIALGTTEGGGGEILAAIAEGYTGFAAGRAEDYDAIRGMMERLRLAQY
ncbi:MAG TPA: phosphate/phosphite/phosphonate ABC transporter substrate-binding protein [bacterium]